MEMKISMVGSGLSIPKTGFSVNILSYAYFFFRNAKGTPPTVFGLDQVATVGEDAQTLIVSEVTTDWIFLDPKRNSWSLHKQQLVGKIINLEIDGTLLGSGRIDIRMDEISGQGFVTNLLTRDNIKATGGQLATSSIRGQLLWKPTGVPKHAHLRMGKKPNLSRAGHG